MKLSLYVYYFNKFVYILRFVQFHSIQFYFSNDTPDRAQQNNGYTKIHHLNTYTGVREGRIGDAARHIEVKKKPHAVHAAPSVTNICLAASPIRPYLTPCVSI